MGVPGFDQTTGGVVGVGRLAGFACFRGDGLFEQAVPVVVDVGQLGAVGLAGADQASGQIVVVAGDGPAVVAFFDDPPGLVTHIAIGLAVGVGDGHQFGVGAVVELVGPPAGVGQALQGVVAPLLPVVVVGVVCFRLEGYSIRFNPIKIEASLFFCILPRN